MNSTPVEVLPQQLFPQTFLNSQSQRQLLVRFIPHDPETGIRDPGILPPKLGRCFREEEPHVMGTKGLNVHVIKCYEPGENDVAKITLRGLMTRCDPGVDHTAGCAVRPLFFRTGRSGILCHMFCPGWDNGLKNILFCLVLFF